MRKTVRKQGVAVLAISGTHVVQLAFDLTPSKRKGLLGFAIHREDHTESEQYWLRGFRTFEQTYPNPPIGSLVSTEEHPVQSFEWGDYTAKPEHDYTYTVVPLYGAPKNLVRGPEVRVRIKTPSEHLGEHSITFNRGVAGSQAFARKFPHVTKAELRDPKRGKEARKWLSRGLEEAILAFIGQADGPEYSLRAAVYEFSWAPVLEAFKRASKQGADVKIIYDRRGKPGTGKRKRVWQTTEPAVKRAGIGKLMISRKTASPIAHNKFIVLLKNGKPIQVWTGSTNFTAGGIFGQSNVGHAIRIPGIAREYADYWERLEQDPVTKDLRVGNDAFNRIPKHLPPKDSVAPLFSPQGSLRALEWYGERMAAARQTLCFTAAFGVSKALVPALTTKRSYPRYLLVESEGNAASQKLDFEQIRAVKNNVIAKGAFIKQPTGTEDGASGEADRALGGELHRWAAEELTHLNTNVKYLHTKYLLVDPLTPQPLVISGSANFSAASTQSNDENMVVLHGFPEVADVFFGEFMRLFHHFYFRSIVNRLSKLKGKRKVEVSPYLVPDDSWAKAFFKPGTPKYLERRLYANAMKHAAKRGGQ